MRTEELLVQSQSLAQELQSGQAELQETNRRLELQAQSLQTSEDLLKRQQEELQKTNQELEEKARLLSEQKSEVEQKNRQIELASTALEDKAKQLALSSKYKSEFLAKYVSRASNSLSIQCSFFRRCCQEIPITLLQRNRWSLPRRSTHRERTF
jgi:septal ring factor EnvC (AmiA/AmiB activator)